MCEQVFVLTKSWTSKKHGNAGELSAMTWLTEAGARVYTPLFEDPDCDLIADFLDGRPPQRIQVKTSTFGVTSATKSRWQLEPGTKAGMAWSSC